MNGTRPLWWPSHVQNLMSISMRWSPDVLSYYGWNEELINCDDMASLYKCAKKYPRFKIDFVPQANLVRWLKHCSAVLKINDSKTQEKHFANRDVNSANRNSICSRNSTQKLPSRLMGRILPSPPLASTSRIWKNGQKMRIAVSGLMA